MNARRILPLVILVLLGSAVLGVIRLRELSFWFDEISSIQFATGDLVANLQRFADQMPAYFIVLRGWIMLVGQSEVAGRWLSLLLGLLTLAITFRLVWRYASLRIATLTLITLASSAVFLRYYREMRPYMFLACVSIASMWFYLAWLRAGRRRDAIAYVIVTSVMLYTHFFTGLLVAAQGVYFLITVRPFWRYRRGWITLGLHALTGLALLPYLGFYFSGLNLIASRGKHPAALTNAQAIETIARALTNDSLALFAVLILLAFIAARKQRLFTLALIWLGLPVVVVLLVHAFVIPVLVNPRYLLFVWPALAILVAFGIEALNRRTAVITVGILIAFGAGQVISNLPASFPGVLTDHPWREMFTVIRDNARSSDLLITNMIDPVGVSGFREPIGYYFTQYAPGGMAKP
ncbi:MAG: glycosyltransferase family 39 protein, partial [Anaerolineae bacterium]|nr:glycosyltransferase family 39 protein [Anaerolineae bacterium]